MLGKLTHNMAENVDRDRFKLSESRTVQTLVVLAIFTLTVIVMSFMGISLGALQIISPAWVGILLFAYFGFRFVRAMEKIAKTLE